MRRRGFIFGRQERQNLPAALQQAHDLMEQGNFAQAAPVFEQLAAGAENRFGPRAPFLFLQAGRARMMMGETATGMRHIRHGLELLAGSGHQGQLARAGSRTARELESREKKAQAAEVWKLLEELGIKNGPNADAAPQGKQGKILPTHCPSCGGPLKIAQADWIEPDRAECPYCGSPVQAE